MAGPSRVAALALVSATFLTFVALLHSTIAAASDVMAPRAQSHSSDLTDAEIAPYQARLLDLAYESASSYPLVPHIKNRSRAQHEVVRASLALDQPRRALAYIAGIANWRRGDGYADLAYYLAESGRADDAEPFLQLASDVADTFGIAEWRRDRIHARIAQTYAIMGRPEDAARFGRGLVSSQAGKLEQVEAARSDTTDYEAQLAKLDALAAPADFDTLQNLIPAYAELYRRNYADLARRTELMARIDTVSANLPFFARLETLLLVASHAADHGDTDAVMKQLEEVERLLDSGSLWLPEEMDYRSRMARLRLRAGEPQQAEQDVDRATERYEAGFEDLKTLQRAGALRPLAEVTHLVLGKERALEIYKRVATLGAVNPNIRPRITDLVATCCSLALHEVEPDAELWDLLESVHAKREQP